MPSDTSDNPAAEKTPSPVPPGGDRRSLGKFLIERKLGAGGMGAVYLANDTEGQKTVALKILPRQKAENPALVRRFQSEADAAAQLKHDHITAIYEAGQIEGYLYLSLEYVDGTDVLKELHQNGPMSVERSLEVVRQVCRALEHAFERGIVHRDIKPSNFLLDRKGNVKLADMGLARSVDEHQTSGVTRVGTTVGTVDYMAPEQAQDSRSADIRSDIYSLGCAWYHMVTGSPPFPGGSLTNKLFAHQSAPRPDPRKLNPAISPRVVQVIRRMMARSPQNRYQTPDDLLEDLDRIAMNLDPQAVDLSDDLPETSRPPESSVVLPSAAPRESSRRRRQSRRKASQAPAIPKKYLLWGIGGLVSLMLLMGAIWAGLTWYTRSVTGDGDALELPVLTQQDHPDTPENDPPIGEEIPVVGNGGDPENTANTGNTSSNNTADTSVAGDNSTKSDPPDLPDAPGELSLPNPDNIAGIRIGRFSERPWMPLWVAGVFSAEDAAGNRSVFSVGRTTGEPSDFADLAEALNRAPSFGTVLKLVGDGPFVLPPITLADRGELVITAAEGSRPVILLVPGTEESTESVLNVTGGSLVLDGVHLTAAAESFHENGKLALVSIDGGGLAVRNGSLTLQGTRQGETVGFRATGRRTTGTGELFESRILFDRAYVSGDSLTALEIDQPAADFVCSNSVLASLQGPVIRISETSSRDALPDGSAPRRNVRIFSSTVVATGDAFDISTGVHPTDPPPTAVRVFHSVFGAGAGGENPTLVMLEKWPPDLESGAGGHRPKGGPPVKRLTWQNHDVLLLGWENLVVGKPASFVAVQGKSTWERFWSEPPHATRFEPVLWPGRRFRNLGRLSGSFFNTAAIDGVDTTAAEGNPLGAAVEALSVAGIPSLRRALALADRPRLQRGLLKKLLPRNTVSIDANSRDVGRVINSTQWPDGTLFVVSGSGTRTSSAVRVRGKSLKIRFQSLDGNDPLIIRPRPIPLSNPEMLGDTDGAFLSIHNGSLEIQDGRFVIPNSRRQAAVRWFLDIADGGFAFTRTSVQGPMLESPGYRGMIRWRDTRDPDAFSADGNRPPAVARFSDCYLTDPRRVLTADFHRRVLVCQNSILAGLETLFQLHINGSDLRHDCAVDIDRCTLLGGDRLFEITTRSRTGREIRPLQFFVSRSVLTPWKKPEVLSPPSAVLLTVPANFLHKQEITWWGNRNGYTGGWDLFFQDAAGSFVEAQTPDVDWVGLWSPERIEAPLFGAEQTRFASALPPPLEFTPASFRLDRRCAAAGWSEDGKPIGADILSLLEIVPPANGD